MKKWIIILSMLIPLTVYAFIPLSGEKVLSRSNSSGLADGFYHFKNSATGRYISINDTDPSNYPISSTGDVNMAGIRTYINYDSVAVSPSCVIYIRNLGDGKYDLHSQSTSLYNITTMIFTFIDNGNGTFKISGKENGITKILSDGSANDDDSWMQSRLEETQDWYIIPINTSDEFIAVRPDVKTADDTYYGTIYAGFNFRLASPGMVAFYVSNAGGTGFTMTPIEGDIVPSSTPVIIRCNSANIEDNKIEPVIGSYLFNNSNWLGGVYCSLDVSRHHNTTLFDRITMRILGLSDDGELAFVSNPSPTRLYKDQYLMANKAYLKVNPGDADVMIDMNATPSSDKVILTAKSYTREYGEPNPLFEYNKKGSDINGKPSIICDATETSPVGDYVIKISKGDITNSNVEYIDGILTITKAPLTITANSYTREEGEENPSLEVTYKGFKNNETEEVLTKKPTVTTSATSSSKPGVYDITVSGAEAQNYSFKYIKGKLTVTGNNNLSLIVESTGAGSVSSEGWTIRNESRTFDVVDGASVIISLLPDDGNRIKNIWLNNKDVTSDVLNNQYTISNIKINTTLKVEFEAIPINSYTLKYLVDGETYKIYEMNEGATITPEPEPIKDGYTFSGWSEIPTTMPENDVTVIGTFNKNGPDINDIEKAFTIDGINYEVVSTDDQTVIVATGDYGQILEVPSSVIYGNYSWNVIGLEDGALEKCKSLAAVIWNPSAVFNARLNNPNFLLYVKDKTDASFGVSNVVVNGIAESIELTDASGGNDFYCPKAFVARNISYSHHYNMETGLGDSKGWETIVLPFDVQNYTHATKGELESFTTWSKGSNKKPFWLFELTANGYKDAAGIKANTPYIISLPNNKQYEQQYQIPGIVTFSASDVEVQKSEDLKLVSYQGRTFVPNYSNKSGDEYLALNVSNNYVTNSSKDIAGSKFIRGLRAVHPFEAYMTTMNNTRSIDVLDGMTTTIRGIKMVTDESSDMKVYDTRGILLKTVTSMDDVKNGLRAGVYIVKGKKVTIK